MVIAVSITIMEAIDNAFALVVPGATDAGIDDPLIYASIAGGFVLAYPFAFLANRYMIARGRATPTEAQARQGAACLAVSQPGRARRQAVTRG